MGGDDKQRKHVVVDGDRMSKIAHENGYADYYALYMAQPEAFRKKRPNPEILMPGDEIVLPDKVEAKYPAKDKKAHQYEENTKLPEVAVTLMAAGKPVAGKTFQVIVDPVGPGFVGAPRFAGTVKSDDKGKVKLLVDPEASSVLLSCVEVPFTILLRLGELRPVTEAGGVEQRLDNLGYRVPVSPPSAPAGSDAEKKAKEAHDRRIKKAAARFQEDKKKTADGNVDADLRDLLVKAHEP